MDPRLVLVVDDDPRIRDIVGYILTEAGYKVASTGDPEEALRITREVVPDVALLDVMMPRFDGFDLCSMIKQHPDTERIPVIFLSARGDDLAKVEGRYSGGAVYLEKPFLKQDLLDAVRGCLKEAGTPVPGGKKAKSTPRARDSKA